MYSVIVSFGVISLLFLFLSSRDFSGLTPHFWCQKWDTIPLVFVVHTLQTQSCNTQVLIMAAKDSGYDSWSLEDLRAEASSRSICFTSKDGIKTLASKLRVHDKLMANPGDVITGDEEMEQTETEGNLTFEQQLQLQERELMMLELRRKMQMEEREAEKEKREYERQRAREEEERLVREEERLRILRSEKEQFAVREAERQYKSSNKPRFMKIREMREEEDIDDYFRIFEMTAKAQSLPESEWVGNLVPKFTEKAKSIYLEIPDPKCQNYHESKNIIIKAYQLTADHYRFRFRTSEKQPEEDFVQWGNRTRRYLNRWMEVAGAARDAEMILEQIMIERLLDAVSPELRAWLKEQKPTTAEELGNLANLHVQARKGPLVAGKYASFGRGQGFKQRKEMNVKKDVPPPEGKHDSRKQNSVSPNVKNTRPEVTCFKFGKKGHMSFNCGRTRNPTSQGYLLCLTPLNSEKREFPPCNVKGRIAGKPAEMIVDSGCTRTLVHKRFVSNDSLTGEKMTVLTAAGERLVIPLAWVEFESEHGRHRELVGALDKLPVDCLLGRSSFGKTLSKQNVLDQWENNTSIHSLESNEAFVLTRRQKVLQEAQIQADEVVDRENALALRNLSKKETKKEGLRKGDLPTLFEEPERGEIDEESPKGVVEESGMENLLFNILDRNRGQVIEDQRTDVTLDKARSKALQKAPEEGNSYFIENDLLMHRKFLEDVHDGLRYVARVVVPEAYRNEILRVAHTIPLAGHMGSTKTLNRIEVHFFWPGISLDVRKFCATCPQCQLVARNMKSHRAPLNPVKPETEPFRKIAIDIVGELPRTTTRYKYILTIVDYATRYPEAIPLRNTSSKTIADALVQYFCRVGIPEELVSDQGSNFISNLMAQLYDQLGITKIQTSVYHPEANGLVERFNGTLKRMLKKFVRERVKNWDKFLPYLLFAYREVPCESTGYSPFELLYGQSVRGPLAVIKETWLEKHPSKESLVSHVLEIRRRLAMMQKAVQEHTTKMQRTQKRLYDVHSSKRRLEVGDKALVLLPTPGSKLEVCWQGPFKVTKVLNDGLNYELDTGKTHKQHRTYHINLLSKWQSRDEIAALVMPESSEMPLPHERDVPQAATGLSHDVVLLGVRFHEVSNIIATDFRVLKDRAHLAEFLFQVIRYTNIHFHAPEQLDPAVVVLRSR